MWFWPEFGVRKSGCGAILSIFFVRDVEDWWRRPLLRLAADMRRAAGERVRGRREEEAEEEDDVA